MGLERQQAAGLHELEQAVLQPEQLDIGLLGVARAPHQRPEYAHRLFEDGTGVADDIGAERRPKDDQRLERLHQHLEMAAHRHVAPQDTGEDHDDADSQTHETNPRECPDITRLSGLRMGSPTP